MGRFSNYVPQHAQQDYRRIAETLGYEGEAAEVWQGLAEEFYVVSANSANKVHLYPNEETWGMTDEQKDDFVRELISESGGDEEDEELRLLKQEFLGLEEC